VVVNEPPSPHARRRLSTAGFVTTARTRHLNGTVVRMATLARGGRITTEILDEEIVCTANGRRTPPPLPPTSSPAASASTSLR
jgi:sigma54-dependent transcription regulator